MAQQGLLQNFSKIFVWHLLPKHWRVPQIFYASATWRFDTVLSQFILEMPEGAHQLKRGEFMSELDMWNILAGFMSGNAIWFLAYVVATWLGFRMTNNIYMDGSAPIVGKILVSLYCLSVSAFMYMLIVNTNGLFRDVAAGLKTVGQTGELSAAAQAFIEQASDAPSMNPIQVVFVVSIIIMQLLQVWMRKTD